MPKDEMDAVIAALIVTWRKRAKEDMRYGADASMKCAREYYGCVNAAFALAECADELEAALSAMERSK